MKVISWNIHRCIGTDGHYSPERVAHALRSMNADIIALQEVDSSLIAADGLDQLSSIASIVGMTAVMGPTMMKTLSVLEGAYGNALLTRYPIVSTEEFDLSYRKFEPRGALVATLLASDRKVRVTNVHLGLKYWERAFQIDLVLTNIVWRDDESGILLGDFNEWLRFSPNIFRLERSFQKSRRLATFPSGWPRLALDRIFTSGSIERCDLSVSELGSREASDHLPLVGHIRFQN